MNGTANISEEDCSAHTVSALLLLLEAVEPGRQEAGSRPKGGKIGRSEKPNLYFNHRPTDLIRYVSEQRRRTIDLGMEPHDDICFQCASVLCRPFLI